MIAIGAGPLGSPNETRLVTGELVSGGKPTILLTTPLPGGPVMSVQPDGTVQGRPAGANGSYEVLVIEGSTVVFCPDGKNAYKFLYSPVLPA